MAVICVKLGHYSSITALFSNNGDSLGLLVTHFCGSVNRNLLYSAAE